MAEAIGAASGILTLITAAVNSSVSLHRLIKSFRNCPKAIRDLKIELETLEGVLVSLESSLSLDVAQFSTLKLPLARCADVCDDFRALLEKTLSRSSDQDISFRDWAKLTYRGDDIAVLQSMLCTYRSTISIALSHANLQTARVTTQTLADYKQMISDTSIDLRERLEKINHKLDALSAKENTMSSDDLDNQIDLEQEKTSTEQCLAICAGIATEVSKCRPKLGREIVIREDQQLSNTVTAKRGFVAEHVVATMLREFEERLLATTSDLRARLNTIESALKDHPSHQFTPASTEYVRQSMEDEQNTVKHCLGICEDATRRADEKRANHFEDISSSHDGQQILISTVGDLIHAKRVTADARTAQWMGQMSDASLQQLSQQWRFRDPNETEDEGPRQ